MPTVVRADTANLPLFPSLDASGARQYRRQSVISYKAAVFVVLGVACGSPVKTPEGAPGAPPSREPAAPVAPDAKGQPRASRAPPRLERTYTGQAAPTLIVKNRFPIGQHVFLDSKRLGRVETMSNASFEVSAGVHTLTSADSADQDNNPVSITESFESGFSYSYEIAPE